MRISLLSSCLFLILLSGCASYATPGRGADLQSVGLTDEARRALTSDASLSALMDKKPLARFPAGVAVARIQSPLYRSPTATTWGHGPYTVVTSRDVEKSEHFDRLGKLPMLQGIAPINRLLLPEQFKSDLELRQAAASLHADMLLIYTLDTIFYAEQQSEPLSTITLGLSPTKKVRMLTTASAVLMDTRNGYIYGLAESTARREQLTSAWDSEHAADQSRLKTESEAFDGLVGELEKTWAGVVKQYASLPLNSPAANAPDQR